MLLVVKSVCQIPFGMQDFSDNVGNVASCSIFSDHCLVNSEFTERKLLEYTLRLALLVDVLSNFARIGRWDWVLQQPLLLKIRVSNFNGESNLPGSLVFCF